MTDTPNTDLIKRLESAEQGSQELDAEVEVVIRWEENARAGVDPEHQTPWRALPDGGVTSGRVAFLSPPHTTDPSAAVALVERVLPEARFLLQSYTEAKGRWYAEITTPEWARDLVGIASGARTASLAIVIALLKALEAKEAP
jgi:hypothetical protein